MDNYSRNRDLEKVFNERWDVNANTSKNISEHVKEFQDRLFNTNDQNENNPVDDQLNKQNQKMEGLRNNKKFWR